MDEQEFQNAVSTTSEWESGHISMTLEDIRSWLSQLREDNPEERNLASKLYGLMARDRFFEKHRFDPLVKSWLQKGQSLSADEPVLKKLSSVYQLFTIRDTVFTHALPSIRETDQSSARKKAVEQLKHAAEQEIQNLKEVMEWIDDPDEYVEEAAQAYDIDLSAVRRLLDEGSSAYVQLKEAAQGYLDTVSGSFYPPEQVKKMQSSLNELTGCSRRWQEMMNHESLSSRKEDDPLAALNQVIGMERVKQRVHRLYHYLEYQRIRKEKGYTLHDERSLHIILTGNPGTGKTMLAHLLAAIYKRLGLLQQNEVLEADRSHLVGAYVGQTEEKTMNLVKEAVGGVLFIDEAYSLKRDGMDSNDFGQTAIDTLLTAMTNSEYAGTFAVIMAGYPEEMRQFLRANPGLRSRFPETNHIHLPDYSMDELIRIAEQTAFDNDFVIREDGRQELQKRIENVQVDESFGNARSVKDIIMDAIFQKGASIGHTSSDSIDDFAILTGSDVKDPVLEERHEKEEQPMERLDELIGLEDVKQEIKKLAAFIQVQNQRRQKNLPAAPIQLHTVFHGPPGTGKTTVAGIYAGILRELGLLKRGHLIVAGRSDLVAEYTGQTAVKTKRKVQEALGGVLFIDEAYALGGAAKTDFGREALDTLVEEMTKHEDNLVVILSGYPGPMEELFQLNPGLESRFKKTFYFPSFPPEDLLRITAEYCRKYGYILEEEAQQKLAAMYNEIDTSGNARLAEDVSEEMFQQQALRISEEPVDSEHILRLLTVDDAAAAWHDKQLEKRGEDNERNSYGH
ncbi:AAA family ATPase [Salibacterium halotolerans]|uniref:AAA+-type ATPase, SpoVK/Ycf46/Vps4 family n=1 Tax=Salibacterium halotolerans TaxID=1884432 RepID=A0A1I5UTI4_9BACI|nr:AAA family ATPase [Salibacterium halotolerans]SFP98575.1 AAA+-type ATPase, SpoVK/Ycf46/Vps4 family [Salibacterium halotolerans]